MQGPGLDTDRSSAPELVREQLSRILSSKIFSDSQRMSRFLQFVVERTLAGEGHTLKEYLIGVEVFDRRPSYDPRIDPIVRVEARRLRSKLTEYYNTEGHSCAVKIQLPTGTYVPVFNTSVESVPERAPERSTEKTIAVLPFTNLSSEPETDYFSDGLTEELTHTLTRLPNLRVVAWNSAATFKGREADLAAAVEQLAADVLLRGSVRRAGGRLRIMAQLLDSRTGIVLWSELYDRQLEDIFAVQGEIALSIASALELQLSHPPQQRAATPSTLHAYNLYLLGRHYWNTRSPEKLLKSVELFEQAIAADPNNALAHVGLADAYTILADHGNLPTETIRVAEAAARRAMELDPRMAEPYATVALIRSIHDWNWTESEALYKRAIQVNRNCANAHHWFGIDCLAILGRFDQAEAELLTARKLDPLSSIISESLGLIYVMWGRFDEAETVYTGLLQRDQSYVRTYGSIGRLYTQRGDYDRAIQLFQCGLSKEPASASMLAALGQAFGLSGQRDKALETMKRLEDLATRSEISRTSFAVLHLGLGNLDDAVSALEHAAERRDGPIVTVGVHPLYDPLRQLPRFRRLLRTMHLEEAELRSKSYRKSPQ